MPYKLSNKNRTPERILIFLDRFHWLWLILVAPFLLFPSPKLSIILLVVPGLFLLHWLAVKVSQNGAAGKAQSASGNPASAIPSTAFNGALLLMMVMVLVSLWASNDINSSLPKIAGLVLGLGAFFAVVRVSEHPRGWLYALLVFIGIASVIAMLGILGISTFTNKITLFVPITTHLPRLITGLQGAQAGIHPNEVAGALTWVLPVMLSICVAVFFLPKSRNATSADSPKGSAVRINFWSSIWVKIFCLAATGFLTLIFLLCQSRGAYFALIFSLILALWIVLPPGWRKYYLVLMVLVAIALISFVVTHGRYISDWFTSNHVITPAAVSVESFVGRLDIWARAIYAIQDFPFTGMGMNIFRNAVQVLYPLPTGLAGIDFAHAHNEFLQAALDLGVPGLIAFIALYVNAFWMLIGIWNANGLYSKKANQSSVVISLLVLGMACGLLGHLFYGMTDAVALGAKPGLLYWILLGLIAGLYQQTLTGGSLVKNNAPSADHETGSIE